MPNSDHFICAEDWDANALSILMYVIHGRHRGVPRSASLELLTKIAVLVDYYKC
ncbi:Uu.00g137510.m01.CDS01 [Anthostomella pinea]|uniref:Uu.00g137510.m01.CDS01 n=1 Tax=Anthostomella pinea TaxID=933095 RepID=A0AAI8VJ37_9PEZI|nr:Uu.00g137510.m01.CDS01 [Anthostomella pinea]